MKKASSLFLTLCMVVSLMACGGEGATTNMPAFSDATAVNTSKDAETSTISELAEEPTPAIVWYVEKTVDEFGDITADSKTILSANIEGNFSNTATTSSELSGAVHFQHKSSSDHYYLSFDLLEYTDSPVTFYSSEQMTLKAKVGETVFEYFLTGEEPNGSIVLGGLSSFDHSADILFNELYSGEDIRCIIDIESSQYNFTLQSANFADLSNQEGFQPASIASRNTIAMGWHHSVALKVDGTVVAVGENKDGQCEVSDWSDIVAVSAGAYHTIGLKSDGTVVAVGYNNSGQCDVYEWNDIVAIAAGNFFTLGLKSDGKVVATGKNDSGQCNVTDWSNIIDIAAGANHSVGLKANGTVVTVGLDSDGQGNVEGWSNIIAIAADDIHTEGLKFDGTVCITSYTGSNRMYNNADWNQSGANEWTDILAISAYGHSTFGIKSNGTVVVAGFFNKYFQSNLKNVFLGNTIEDWNGITAIASGMDTVIGLRYDGTVIGIGDNTHGQCNVTEWTDIKQP